ncbi:MULTISPECIES: hypothetical protein [unclassified Clostridioides]|uniref:hypothetical protein n=1 Tax=unclassified Clostridioides TaxID=2635829 RepID=UPI001D10DB35|nr:hypothetical protein [Clostridioides sp. ES-S-0171-01]MCC0687943.1 hypothetical protein [Clostridioides sp. ES-S-0056-01]MCC0714575.1 hypothetical protein [Clostridioides sp. ES-S-0077-01]UDN53433.1 hypothetical protein JJC02_11000 [Clostridioides sp. ES-S-0054-01]
MANIGSTLPQPEQGWKRYDNTDSRIKYINKWTMYNDTTTAYNNTGCITNYRHGENGILEFRFTGPKIRLIVPGSDASHTNKCTVEIDGEKFIASQCTPSLVHPNYIYQMLFFEKFDLTDSIHTVKLYIEPGTPPPPSAPYGDNYLSLDSIDIDTNGQLLHYKLEENKIINDIQIGEYISCDYIYDNGFSNFGDGKTLTFICVKNNFNQHILISDIVIPNLSFDEINDKGFIYGKKLDNHPYKGYSCIIKSITDSPYNDSYLHSEYDKFILNSSLNNLITSGDKDIWHHNLSSITDTFSASDNMKVTVRGGISSNSYNVVNTSTKSDTIGFRPVLIMNNIYLYPEFNIDYTFGEWNGIISITNILLDKTIEVSKIKVKITNKNNTEILYTDLLSVNEGNLNLNISNVGLLNGLNILEIIIEDENGYVSNPKTIKVFKHNKGLIQYYKIILTDNISFDKSYKNMKVKLKSTGSIIGIYTIDNINYNVFDINSIFNINSNNINLLLLMDKDTILNAYKLICEDIETINFDNIELKPLPPYDEGNSGSIDKEEVVKIINETVNSKLDLINKNLNISNLKIQLKYDKELNLSANYTSNYYIDAKLDTVEREGE